MYPAAGYGAGAASPSDGEPVSDGLAADLDHSPRMAMAACGLGGVLGCRYLARPALVDAGVGGSGTRTGQLAHSPGHAGHTGGIFAYCQPLIRIASLTCMTYFCDPGAAGCHPEYAQPLWFLWE